MKVLFRLVARSQSDLPAFNPSSESPLHMPPGPGRLQLLRWVNEFLETDYTKYVTL
jgi:hypothetical protein